MAENRNPIHPSSQTNPVISVRSHGEMLDMIIMLKQFEDEMVEEVMSLPEIPARQTKEKRLSIARGVRAGIEWALGIQARELDKSTMGPEWERWCREYKSKR
jgi:hypothetical protein